MLNEVFSFLLCWSPGTVLWHLISHSPDRMPGHSYASWWAGTQPGPRVRGTTGATQPLCWKGSESCRVPYPPGTHISRVYPEARTLRCPVQSSLKLNSSQPQASSGGAWT